MGVHRDYQLAGWLMLALATGFLAYVTRLNSVTHDAFHEMALYREMLVEGSLPKEDLFAYTPTVSPSVHHEWGTGAVLYWVTVGSGAGVWGLHFLRMACILFLWLFLYRVARMRGAHPAVFALISFVAFPFLWVGFATFRAQLFTLLFLAIQMWMQELDWRGRRAWVIGWVGMLVLWLNLHAGFIVGCGLIAFHSLERLGAAWLKSGKLRSSLAATWHLIVAAPFAVGALLINPYGFDYIAYLVHALRMDRPAISEWRPLWETYSPLWTLAAFGLSIAFFVYAQRFVRFRYSRGAAFLALSAYMALKHIRHGSLYAVIWIAYVPAWITHTPFGRWLIHTLEQQRAWGIRGSQFVSCASAVFIALHQFSFPILPPQPLYSHACYPVSAVDYLKRNDFTGNVMTPFHVGAYVSWEMYPNAKVSLDGRYEVAFQPHVMPEQEAFFKAQGRWWETLEEYPTDAVLIDRGMEIAEKLDSLTIATAAKDRMAEPEQRMWKVAYEDDVFVLLVPETSGLMYESHLGEALVDGVHEAFSSEHSHRLRSGNHSLANR